MNRVVLTPEVGNARHKTLAMRSSVMLLLVVATAAAAHTDSRVIQQGLGKMRSIAL